MIERYPIKKLPKLGGLNATLVVTITEDSLMGRVEQAGLLDTGEKISPGAARRLGLHTHHETRWAGGGTTAVDQGISLCPWHHSRIHDTAYQARMQPTGKVSFHRRT